MMASSKESDEGQLASIKTNPDESSKVSDQQPTDYVDGKLRQLSEALSQGQDDEENLLAFADEQAIADEILSRNESISLNQILGDEHEVFEGIEMLKDQSNSPASHFISALPRDQNLEEIEEESNESESLRSSQPSD